MRRYFLLKAVGTTVLTWLFFIAYFHLLRNPVYPVVQMPLIWLDPWVPFQPGMLIVYVSLWVYVGIAPGLMFTLRDLVRYGAWAVLLCVLGLGAFMFWPSAVPPLPIEQATDPALAILQGVDAAGNACPSMHVAMAMFTAARLDDVLRTDRAPVWLRLLNGLWFAAIAYSTMAVRQHVALDVLAGAALGAVVAVISLRWRRAAGPDPLSLDLRFRRLR